MTADSRAARGLPAAFLAAGSASFSDFLTQHAPHLAPGAGLSIGPQDRTDLGGLVPHGTTIVAARYAEGVVMAGDRRSTQGNVIAARDIDKVFVADEFSCVGIAGSAGVAVEMVKLYQVELEHFEKIEGTALSLEGKANRLAAMIRANLGLALRGLAVVPLFAGVDCTPTPAGRATARIFSYDITGGCYEERDHHSVGSGAVFARGAMKKLWRPDMSQDAAVRIALECLYDAADDDSATGGPDLGRRIWPTCVVVDRQGARRLTEDTLGGMVADLVEARSDNPGGVR